MRGEVNPQPAMFSYVDLESRIPADHPIRTIREVVNTALDELEDVFEAMYAQHGRPSIPPEMLLRALLLQILFSIRSERQLMERLDYDLLFRWFVGLGMDDPVWNHSTFSRNRTGCCATTWRNTCWKQSIASETENGCKSIFQQPVRPPMRLRLQFGTRQKPFVLPVHMRLI